MEIIIQEIFNSYQQKFAKWLNSLEQLNVSILETEGLPILKAMLLDLTGEYINTASDYLRGDKPGRRKAGLVLIRIGDERRILTKLGEFVYKRDYYFDKKASRCRYPVDEALGVERWQKASDNVGLSLAATAAEMSYAKSSRYVAEGELSRQTVMLKIRSSRPKPDIPGEKRRIRALHVDADEDHVTLIGGNKSIVPLVSVYEGIGQNSKRRYCDKVFHISEYGMGADELWEKVISEIDNRYELEDTIIYLHGDGASWIKTGMEWLPNCRFVLDKYHRNRAIKSMCAGIGDQSLRGKAENGIRDSLLRNDDMLWSSIIESLVFDAPERKNDILASARFLWGHRAAISICETDPEANNGGCSEPHVSHVLSSRLSDRPRTWSKTTLTSIAPMLAKRGELEVKNRTVKPSEPLITKAIVKTRRVFNSKRIQTPRTPCINGSLVPIAIGKINQTFIALRSYN